MGFDERLIHDVAIERSTAGPVDAWNMPSEVWATIATPAALIQPKSGRERAQQNEAGSVTAEFRIYMRPTDITEGDHLIRQDTGEVFEIGFIADAGGIGHHLEIDATRVWP